MITIPVTQITRPLRRKGMQVGEIIKWVVILIPVLILVLVVLTMVVDISSEGFPFAKELIAAISILFDLL